MAAKTVALRRRPPARSFRSRTQSAPKISLAVVAGLMPTVSHIKDRYNGTHDLVGSVSKGLQTALLGHNPDNNTWAWGNAKIGLLPLAAGVGIHKLAGKFGVNRALARAGIPFVNI